MKIMDSSSGHRKITLEPNESLDSKTLVAALTQKDVYNKQEATELAGIFYDAFDEVAWDARHAA